MFIWVKLIAGNSQAFKVIFNAGMDYDDFKNAIANTRGIPNYRVQFIYSADIEAEIFKQKAGTKVATPMENEIGSSDDLPYFYSLGNNNEEGASNFVLPL